MSAWDRVGLAFDLLENANVMQRFEDCIWVEVDREMWEAFKSLEEEEPHKPNCPATDGFGCRCDDEEGAEQ
jgi:hypothetical protein